MIFWCHVVRLVLYSDMPVVAAGLSSVLAGAGFQIGAVCATLPELQATLAAAEPQIVLLDFTAEFSAGILAGLDPLLPARSVVLLVHEIARETALHAISAGVRGIFRSTLPPDQVLRCLERVHAGETWFEKALDEEAFELRRAHLTGREIQLMRLLGRGLRNREIAETLDLTEGTVKVYLSRLFQKLGVKDRFELALYGMKNPAAGSLCLPRAPLVRRGRHRSPPRAWPE